MNKRPIKIIMDTIEKLSLNLNGKTVLTEVGTGNYLYTPIIPAIAGAKRVYAVAKNTKYGNAEETINKCRIILNELNLNQVEFFIDTVPSAELGNVEIITNSGNLRPINENILKFCSSKVVIPLMFEAWEFREEDLDIKYCKQNAIKVAGTWENHPDIKVFDYCGLLAMKMVFDANFEISGNSILVWSNDHFGEIISKKFEEERASVILSNDIEVFYNNLHELDFLFICDYDESRIYFGNEGIFEIERIKKINPDIVFIHLFGNIDLDFCNNNKINISPLINGSANVMTHTLGYVGLIPILRLQVAGYKVAENLIKNNYSTLTQIL